jgi:Family of unknown function (DUF6111)
MPRILLTIVLPLLLPTALYLLWATALRPERHDGAARWTSLPWLWLAVAGVALLAIVLLVVTVHFGAPQEGVYVPPRWHDDHMIPGHIEPGHIEPGHIEPGNIEPKSTR